MAAFVAAICSSAASTTLYGVGFSPRHRKLRL
jgi:hypothetical protein